MKLWGGGKGGSAPDPNPGYIRSAEASEKVGMEQVALGRETLDFYKKQYEEIAPVLKQITDSEVATQTANKQRADEYAAYERDTFRPLEKKLVKEAETYNTDAKREELARTASADVSQAFGVARGQQNRQLAAVGLRPDSNRFAALNNSLLVQEALGKAGAQNKARTDAEGLGYAKLQDAANMGRGLASNASTAYGVSINAGNSAAGNAQAGTNMMGQGYGAASGMYAAGANAYGTAGNIYGNEFNSRMQGYNAQQQAAGGFAKGVGSLIGTGLSMGTGGGASVGAKLLGFADGGPLEKKGAISGPGGPVDDKIPAMLSNGEYVLPADTVKAIGKNKLDKVVKETHTPAEIQRKRKALKGKK
jgi:predicted house-cleaning noncanonical NTP pyrophosphatase (MazG superfamily)